MKNCIRILKFNGHLYRIDGNRLAKQIFTILKRARVSDMWFKEIKKNLKTVGLSWVHLLDCSTYRLEINNFKGFHKETKHRSRWIDERIQTVREHMQRYWATKKSYICTVCICISYSMWSLMAENKKKIIRLIIVFLIYLTNISYEALVISCVENISFQSHHLIPLRQAVIKSNSIKKNKKKTLF